MSEYTKAMSLEEIIEVTTMAEKTLKNITSSLDAVNKNLIYGTLVDRPQGKWIKQYNGNGWDDFWDYKCSNCGKVYERASGVLYYANYCPNCGARIKGGEEE